MSTNQHFDRPEAGARATWDGARTIVWLSGEHDLATADRLAQFLVEESAHGADVVVDLSGVSFMDASTISAIGRARSQLSEDSRSLTVRSPSALVERALGICGLDELIEPAEPAPAEATERASSALETWVAVKTRDPAPSEATRPAPEEAREASRE